MIQTENQLRPCLGRLAVVDELQTSEIFRGKRFDMPVEHAYIRILAPVKTGQGTTRTVSIYKIPVRMVFVVFLIVASGCRLTVSFHRHQNGGRVFHLIHPEVLGRRQFGVGPVGADA